MSSIEELEDDFEKLINGTNHKLLITKDKEKEIILGDKVSYNNILKRYYGYDSLKEEQFQVIDNIISNKRDVCAILATGFGKSVCYQLPSLLTNKSVIVISPLLALMKEQGEEMISKGIPVCVLNGDTPKKDKIKEERELLIGKNKLIYMTPEYFIKSEELIKRMETDDNLLMICIDEAHAVSTWGLDFRPSYTQLSIIREWTNVPILTLTATASTKVKNDIKKILGLRNPFELIGNFDRPNLFIKVMPRKETKNIMDDIGPLLDKYHNDYIIIYCKTREETEKVSEIINNYGIECYAYHAGLRSSDRNDTQQQFNEGRYKCIVATIAFGMGINIPNVRLVIHYNCPKNMESYYQEIGRAGRDGKPSECYLFYSKKDFMVNRFFLKNMTNLEYKKYQEEQIRLIEKYVFTNECRRKLILKTFNQNIEHCNNCDNCKCKPKINKVNYTKHIYLFLGLLRRVDDKYGISMLVNSLLAKGKVKDYIKQFEEYGKGVTLGNEEWWKTFSRTLLNNDLILEKQITGGYGTTISLSNNGKILISELKTAYPKYTDIKDNINIKCELNEISTLSSKYKVPKHKNIIIEDLGIDIKDIDIDDFEKFIEL